MNQSASPSTSGKTILVLEDDLRWQTIVSQLLRKVDSGLQIRCVPTTQAAIQLLAEGEHFDLVVADQYLDGVMTGLDLYKHMRALRDQTSFVMFSGQEADDFRELNSDARDLPQFVSKLHAFSAFNEIVKREIASPEASAQNREGFALIVISLAATALAISNFTFVAKPTPATASAPISVRTEPVKAPVLFHAVKPTALIQAPKKHEFVNRALLSSVNRIVKRADTIDAEVSHQ